MIEVSIVNKNGQELYKCKDNSIDFIYQAQYDEGDKIIVNKKDTDHIVANGLFTKNGETDTIRVENNMLLELSNSAESSVSYEKV
mgnify:CR=1 FL=1